MRTPALLVALTLALAAGCGGADSPTDTTPAPAEEPIAQEQEAPADPAAPAEITVAVQNLTKGTSGPSKQPLAVTATSGTNQITVHLENFTHYCSPEPSFTAAVDGESLKLTVAKPATAVSRCFAPHTLDAVVSLPGRNNVRKVVVVGDSGVEAGSATVTAGK
jgi:hypothetical protein